MWLNITQATMDVADVEEVVLILSQEASLEPILAARGFSGLCVVELTEVRGCVLSLSWWESAEDGQAYLASPECQKVAESIRKFLVRPLERNYYAVHIDSSKPKVSHKGD